MNLKLTKTDWNNSQYVIQEKQKDYDYVEKDNISIFIYGYPFNPSAGIWISGNDVHRLYLKGGLNFIEDIEGVYTIIILDRKKELCSVITDRYGIYSLFYTKNHNHFILSDTVGEIVTHMPYIKLNKQSIIEYLGFGFKFGNKTHIEGIYEFVSATIYQINKELETTEKIYWKLLGKSEKDKITKENFRKIFNAHIMTAFKLEKKISIPLSGGLDTRTIMSACIFQNQKFDSYTYGIKNAPDVKTAKKICDHFKIKHTFFELNEGWIKNIPFIFEKNAIINNGLTPPYSHMTQASFEEYSKDKLIITGALGNEIWRGLFDIKEIEFMTINPIIDKVMKICTYNNPKIMDIYRDYSNKEVINLIKESIKNELMKPEDTKKPISLFELFVLRNWSSNWASNGLKGAGKYFKVFPVFLHKDLLQQISLLNRIERTNGTIQKYIIYMNNSYLANVMLDVVDMRHGATIGNNLSSRIKGLQVLVPWYSRAAVNFVPKRLFKRNIFRTPYFTDYPNWIRNYHKDFLLKILNYEKMVTKELFKKDELEEIILLYIMGDNSLTDFLVRLIGLEIWLKSISKEI